jgi:predicted thioesterase
MVAKYGALVAMENSVERVAGKTVAAKVIADSEQITEKTDKRVVSGDKECKFAIYL